MQPQIDYIVHNPIGIRSRVPAEGIPLAALVRKSMREYLERHHGDTIPQTV